MEPSGSPGAWKKVLTPDSQYHPHGGFPGDAQDPARLEGQEAAGEFYMSGVSLHGIQGPGEPPECGARSKAELCVLVFRVQRQLVLCLN